MSDISVTMMKIYTVIVWVVITWSGGWVGGCNQHTLFFFWLKVYSENRAACFCRILLPTCQTAECQMELTFVLFIFGCLKYLRLYKV
jgi:hypothetical protein